MSSAAQLRIGSLEILAALLAFGLIAVRLRSGSGVAARTVAARLHIQEGPGSPVQEMRLTLGDGLPAAVLGRSNAAQIRLSDPEASRRHASLDCSGGVIYLTDLGSSNGTFLNGTRLEDEGIEVKPGDDIDVGNTRVTVVETVRSWT